MTHITTPALAPSYLKISEQCQFGHTKKATFIVQPVSGEVRCCDDHLVRAVSLFTGRGYSVIVRVVTE